MTKEEAIKEFEEIIIDEGYCDEDEAERYINKFVDFMEFADPEYNSYEISSVVRALCFGSNSLVEYIKNGAGLFDEFNMSHARKYIDYERWAKDLIEEGKYFETSNGTVVDLGELEVVEAKKKPRYMVTIELEAESKAVVEGQLRLYDLPYKAKYSIEEVKK